MNTRRTLAEVLQTTFPWCSEWEAELNGLFLAYVEAKQAARWHKQQMDRLFVDAVVRLDDIQQLARIAATYPSRERFLTELTLDPPDATGDESGAPLVDEDCLDLSTIRSAKGWEWSTVSILNVVDGCPPSDLATGSELVIEEERRLLYVAMTLAKDHLELIVPQRFYVTGRSGGGDRHVYASRTASFPGSCWNASRVRSGRRRRRNWPRIAQSRVKPWIWPPGCGRCGVDGAFLRAVRVKIATAPRTRSRNRFPFWMGHCHHLTKSESSSRSQTSTVTPSSHQRSSGAGSMLTRRPPRLPD